MHLVFISLRIINSDINVAPFYYPFILWCPYPFTVSYYLISFYCITAFIAPFFYFSLSYLRDIREPHALKSNPTVSSSTEKDYVVLKCIIRIIRFLISDKPCLRGIYQVSVEI